VGSDDPSKWGIDDIGTNTSAFPTDPNMKTLYWYDTEGNFNFQSDNPYYVAPSYRYLAFYGEVGNSSPTFHEIELTLGTPLNGSSEIKYGVNDTGITFHESKAWEYGGSDYLTIMNGIKGWDNPNDPKRLQYNNVVNTNAIFWYMDMGSSVAAVNGGTYWTYNLADYAFTIGKLYGTNTNPADFADASLIANYEFVCELTKQTAS